MPKASHKIQSDLTRLEQSLNYSFKNPSLLQDALTHRSAGSKNNERLEFLGDSILNFVIAAEIFSKYPKLSEGDLSRIRASLVNKDGLFRVATDLKLGNYLTLGSGELKSGGHRRNSILADAVEAILGAVYLDSEFAIVRDLVLMLYQDQLNNVPDPDQLKDAKTRLQEILQSRKYSLPNYDVIDVTGQAHNQQFTVKCIINELDLQTEGKASSRRKAEQQAADKIISLVQAKMGKK